MDGLDITVADIKEAAIWKKGKHLIIEMDNATSFDLDQFCDEMNENSGRNQWTRELAASSIIGAFLNQWRKDQVKEKLDKIGEGE